MTKNSEIDFKPNSYTRSKRILNFILIFFLLTYGLYGIYTGELYLPLGRRNEVTLFGDSIYIAFLSFVLGIIYFLAEIIDHYDKRNNEGIYIRIKGGCQSFGLLILIYAIIVNYVETTT